MTDATAFVLAGGGSLGALQVGMLKALAESRIVPDMIVGSLADSIAFHVVPSLCPVEASRYDFSHTRQLINRAHVQTCRWLEAGGLERSEVPHQLQLHAH